jgi:uncharacterized protein YegP (UPF0339 family)
MYFEIVRASGGFRAHIKGGNNELIFMTEVYTTKQSAIHACQIVQVQASRAPIYDRTV